MLDVTALRTGDPAQVAGYRIVRRLGQGGQGVVFLGVGAGGEQVAIKRLWLEDERSRRQFAKEVGAARRVAAFCTARVITFDLEGESPYVVSEFIEGPSLQQLVRESGPLSGSRLHRLAIGTVTALAAIHQAGVVHRDLKPANVMVSADGPRVIDFGIARDMSNETTITSRVFGTPAYMAPEQIRAERVSPQTDMFAWASVMAFAATGRAPFDAKHMMAVVHRITTMEPDLGGVPPALAEVLLPCLNKEAGRRPTAQQTLAMLLGRPAPVHDAEDPTVVLAEGSRLARAATGDSAGESDASAESAESAGLGQTLVTAQDVKVGPALLGPGGVGSGLAGAGAGAGAGVARSAGDAESVAQGGLDGSVGTGPGPAAGRDQSVFTGQADGKAQGGEAGRAVVGRAGEGRGAGNVPDARGGQAATGQAADGGGAVHAAGQAQGAVPVPLGRAAEGRGASNREPRPGRESVDAGSSPSARISAAGPGGITREVEPVETATVWSGRISQEAETIPTPVPPLGQPGQPGQPGQGSARSGGSVPKGSVPKASAPERSVSDRSASGGPGFEKPASGGPGFEKPASGGPGFEKPASDGPGFEKPASGGPGSEKPASGGPGLAGTAPRGLVRPGSDRLRGPEAAGQALAEGARVGSGGGGAAPGAHTREPEYGTPEPLIPAPSAPTDATAYPRRKGLAEFGSGVGAILVVLLLGGGMVAGGTVALRALLDRGSPGTGSGSGQIGGSTEPPATPASEVLPDWTTGEWSGEVYQPTGQVTSYEVQISLQAGVAQGQLEIPDLGCAGALTVKSSTESTVVLTTRLEDDLEGGCVDQSTLQLTRAGGDQLLYAWKDDGQAGNHADGTVTRE